MRIATAIAAAAPLGALPACASRPPVASGAAPQAARPTIAGQAAENHPAPAPTPARPALLAVGQEVHLLVLEGEHATCQAWTVEDDHGRPIQEHAFRLARRLEHAVAP